MNEVDTFLKRQIENHRTPSVQYVVFNEDRIIHEFLGGYADIKDQKKTSKNTTYNGYSITKTFTAMAILPLAELQKIDIEQPIKRYLRELA